VLKTWDASVLTASGRVKVLRTLRVPLANGRGNVWALGDIIEWDEQKGVAKVPSQVATVVANVVSGVNKQEGVKEYGGFMDGIGIPLGPNAGRTYLPLLWGLVFGDWFTSKLKGRTLFADAAHKQMGY
jgi:apoptosis-inducing factor 2